MSEIESTVVSKLETYKQSITQLRGLAIKHGRAIIAARQKRQCKVQQSRESRGKSRPMISPPIQEIVNLRCPICGHIFSRLCPIDYEGIILLEDDLCPICKAQAEIDPS